MADSWLFNAGLYLVLLNYLDFQTIKILLLSAFTAYVAVTCVLRLMRARENRMPAPANTTNWSASVHGFRGDWVFVLFLMALPVINPWYVAWVLPFATLYPRWWSWSLSYCCLISYWYGTYSGATEGVSLQLAPVVVAVEYLTIVAIPLIAVIVIRRVTTDGAYVSYTRM